MSASLFHTPLFIIVVLLLAGFVVPLLAKRQRLAEGIFLVTGAISLLLSLSLVRLVLRHGLITYNLGNWAPPFGIQLLVDSFGAYASLVLSVVSLPVYWFIVFAPNETSSKTGYLSLVLFLTAAMQGMVLTGDLFNMFVFIEISSLAAIAIIAIKGTRESIEASFRYLVLSALGSGGILFAIALIFMISGHLNMGFIREALSITASQYPLNILTALGFMFVGFAIKAALFPLHIWLPEAHSNAPTASSALLSGLVVKVYIIGFMRVMYLGIGIETFNALPLRPIFLLLSSLAIIMGSIFAMVQDNLKRMMAYSTVVQIGYIFLGFGLFSPRAVEGGVLHILNHAVTKALLFLTAGVIIKRAGVTRISQLKGMGRKMPWTFAAFTIGALSMVGIPGFAGFVSKLYVALGALDISQAFFAVLILVSSLLNALYYFPITINAFFGEQEPLHSVSDPPMAVLASLAVLAGMCVILGLFPSVVVPLVRQTSLLFIK
jgi:multicomponent Na+:H+ antiporter subunit D